ncbi:MAG: ABC transporter substrate-binding protein [Flavobacterium sp.]|nr:ABC transporter substrate-binding protein [Flavobacterium sp.]
MKNNFFIILSLIIVFSFIECKKDKFVEDTELNVGKSTIRYAKGFSIKKYKGFSVLKITNPWPKANKSYTYVLKEKTGIIPDSLINFTTINVPIKSVIVTSTTHIPSLELLGVTNSLIGFPNLNFVSSSKTRARIEAKKVKEIGVEQNLNTEVILDLNPDLIIGFGIDNNNPSYDNLEKSGLKVIFNGDWNEQSPLGKAEWIKFFGALYGLDKKAITVFNQIEKDYNSTVSLAKNATKRPIILCGEMYENVWYTPRGNSWSSLFLKDAKTNYLWSNTTGTGSLSLPFETVLDKAQKAEYWFQGSFSSLAEMQNSNIHYNQFDAFKNKKIYSFSGKKGKTGGILFYELAGNRPDLVLKDIIKIVHPELLPDYEMFFYSKLE